MLEIQKLPGDLREAVIHYNRSLLSSCLAAYILRFALKTQGIYGNVYVVPYHTQHRETSSGFEPKEHPDVVDLFLVGVEGYERQLLALLNNESIRSVTMFPIAIGGAKSFFDHIKHMREIGDLSLGVSVELVTDRIAGNLPAVVKNWCTVNGMATGEYATAFVQGYARIMEGKVRHHTEHADHGDLADVFYRNCITHTAIDSSELYNNRLNEYTLQLTKFADMMQYGFDSWVAKGIAVVEHSRDALQGNLLMAVSSQNQVVIAPNMRDESFTLGYLLRQRFPQSRAIVLYHQQRDQDYVYRVLRGATPTHNPFNILANVARDGRPQAVISSSLGPDRVHRIADTAMMEQLPPRLRVAHA